MNAIDAFFRAHPVNQESFWADEAEAQHRNLVTVAEAMGIDPVKHVDVVGAFRAREIDLPVTRYTLPFSDSSLTLMNDFERVAMAVTSAQGFDVHALYSMRLDPEPVDVCAGGFPAPEFNQSYFDNNRRFTTQITISPVFPMFLDYFCAENGQPACNEALRGLNSFIPKPLLGDGCFGPR